MGSESIIEKLFQPMTKRMSLIGSPQSLIGSKFEPVINWKFQVGTSHKLEAPSSNQSQIGSSKLETVINWEFQVGISN